MQAVMVMQNSPFSSLLAAGAISSTYYAYSQRDGQAELNWMAWLNTKPIYQQAVTDRGTKWPGVEELHWLRSRCYQYQQTRPNWHQQQKITDQRVCTLTIKAAFTSLSTCQSSSNTCYNYSTITINHNDSSKQCQCVGFNIPLDT